jgi:hypothetical protein
MFVHSVECQWSCCIGYLSILNSTGETEKSVMKPVQGIRFWWGGGCVIGGGEHCGHPVIWSFRSCTFTQFCLLCEFLVITDHTTSLLKFISLGIILHVILWSLASKLCTLPTISELKIYGHPLWGSFSASSSDSWKHWHHKNVCVDDRALSPSHVCNISCVSVAVFHNFMEMWYWCIVQFWGL